MRAISFLFGLFVSLPVSLPSVAAVPPASPAVWKCQVTAQIHGNTQHFMAYGQDAWNGPGLIYCESGGESHLRPIKVSFNSLSVGFGADLNSNVQLLMDLTTSVAPADFQYRRLVSDTTDGPQVNWDIASALSKGKVFVVNATPSLANQSLRQGNLYIRGTGD